MLSITSLSLLEYFEHFAFCFKKLTIVFKKTLMKDNDKVRIGK